VVRKSGSVRGPGEQSPGPTRLPPTTPTAAGGRPEPPASAGGAEVPDPAVSEKPVRRRFRAEYKIRILREADRCTQPGQLGALLRREGLYASHLNTWRRQRDAGALAGLAPKRRGRKPKADDPVLAENQRLRRENQRLAEKLRQAEAIIEVQKKLSELLGVIPMSPDHREDKS